MDDAALSGKVLGLEEEIRDLNIKNDQLKRFLEIGKILNAERDINKLIPLVMIETRKCVDADRCTVFLINLERSELPAKYADGLQDQSIRLELKMGIVGMCVLTRKILNVMDAYEETYFKREVDRSTGYRTQSVLCAPFFDPKGEAIGAVQLINKKSGLFTRQDETRISDTCCLLTNMAQTGEFKKDAIEPLIAGLRKATDSDRGSIFLLDRKEMKLSSLIAEGLEGPSIFVDLNLGIAGYVAITGQEENIPDAYSDPRFDSRVDRQTGYRTRNILCLPIKNQVGDILGVIQVLNRRCGVFTDSDVELLRALVPQIAIAIDNAILFEEQNQQWQSFLEVLAASIDAKDSLTAGHSHKVAEYAVGIARELGLSETEMDILRVSSLLHDYGKLGVSDEVLKKPGKLTAEEYEHIKQHIPRTQSILSRMRFMRRYRGVPKIASCHHERLDGTGYSGGLKAFEIPFMSKILAVADVFEALTAKRHYRDAMSVEDALKILEKDIDTKFDGTIASAMKRYLYKLPSD